MVVPSESTFKKRQLSVLQESASMLVAMASLKWLGVITGEFSVVRL